MNTNNHGTKVAYLVVCWNNKEIIAECLDAILSQTLHNRAVYVLDNDSADGTADYISEKYPDVHLIRSNVNSGFSKGNNTLIKECLADQDITHIALVNSDAILDKGWTESILKEISNKQNVAAAQGLTLDYFNHNIVDSMHVFIRNDLQSVQYGFAERYLEEYTHPRRVFGVNAAAAIYTREFVESQKKSKLFDERFYMYLEDVDVAFRSVMAGWANYYVPEARAYHMGSVSAKRRSSDYSLYMTYRNQTALMVKNLPLKTFLKLLPTFLRHERNLYRHLKKEQKEEALKMVIKGRIVGLLRGPLFLGTRLRLLSSRKITSKRLKRVIDNSGIF